MTSTIEELRTAYNEARAEARRTRTPEAREAVQLAWAALDAASPKLQRWGRVSRVGKRAHAEYVARYGRGY